MGWTLGIMRYLGIGTAKQISKIGLGTWQFGSREWGYGDQYADQVARAIVRRALAKDRRRACRLPLRSQKR